MTDDVLAEVKLMHQLRHENVLQLLAVITETEPLWIITELLVNGDLLDFLRMDEGKALKFLDLAYIAEQVCRKYIYQSFIDVAMTPVDCYSWSPLTF